MFMCKYPVLAIASTENNAFCSAKFPLVLQKKVKKLLIKK